MCHIVSCPNTNPLKSLVLNLKPYWDVVYQHFHILGFGFPVLASLNQHIFQSSQLEWRVLKSSGKYFYAVGPSIVAVVSGYLDWDAEGAQSFR